MNRYCPICRSLAYIVFGLFLLAAITAHTPVRAETPSGVDEPSSFTVVEERAVPQGINAIVRVEMKKDAFLSSRQPNRNFGGESTLDIGWLSGVYDAMRILIEFDISAIPANATINGATLYVYQTGVTPPGDQPMTFRAQYMRSQWEEFAVTWNNANYLGGDALPLGEMDGTIGWKLTNVTDLVRRWHNGSQQNFGLILTGDEVPSNNRSRMFLSKQSGSAPYVMVDYTISCDTVPPVATVEPLPLYSPGSFEVFWSGTDFAPSGCPPTGIAYYDVEYRIDGSAWHQWKNQTTSTSGTFKNWANNADFVEFRARAADHGGNVQSFGSPQASTRIDTEAPIASVNPLPQYTITPAFLVTWGGTDNLSGIATYDVQWREQGDKWNLLYEETTLTQYQVTGAQSGKSYELRARATDNVGNAQEWSETAQASTTVFAYPVSTVLPFVPSVLKPTAPVTTSFPVKWTGFNAPGTTITTYEIYFRFQQGAWSPWQTFPGNQTSAQFDYADMGLGDGIYEFESVATNNLGEKEPRNGQSEASILVDMADVFQPMGWLPSVSATDTTQ